MDHFYVAFWYFWNMTVSVPIKEKSTLDVLPDISMENKAERVWSDVMVDK